jgi:nucleosome binding factor SPN SPT16 subunit
MFAGYLVRLTFDSTSISTMSQYIQRICTSERSRVPSCWQREHPLQELLTGPTKKIDSPIRSEVATHCRFTSHLHHPRDKGDQGLLYLKRNTLRYSSNICVAEVIDLLFSSAQQLFFQTLSTILLSGTSFSPFRPLRTPS